MWRRVVRGGGDGELLMGCDVCVCDYTLSGLSGEQSPLSDHPRCWRQPVLASPSLYDHVVKRRGVFREDAGPADRCPCFCPLFFGVLFAIFEATMLIL